MIQKCICSPLHNIETFYFICERTIRQNNCSVSSTAAGQSELDYTTLAT